MALIDKATLSRKYRPQLRSNYWSGQRKKIAISIVVPFIILQLLFLGLQAYIYGSVYRSGQRVEHLKVLAIDYDGGIIGQSIHAADEKLKAPSFLGLHWHSPEEYPTPEDVREAVCKGRFWAGIYSFSSASDRLAAALSDNTTAMSYDSTQAMGYVFNEARYPTVADGDVLSNLNVLIEATRLAYNQINGTRAVQSIPRADSASIGVALNPIQATEVNIKPMDAGGKVFYNTVGQVFTVLLQFFFLMAFNSALSDLKLFSRMSVGHNAGMRMTFSLLYTLIGALCVTANIYAFRERIFYSAAQFFELWMAFWLELHVLFLVLEVATTFLVMPFLPLFIITFIIMNVASCVMPFDLNPGFYRWGYALPCHEMYHLEIKIMSGCGSDLDIALPVLFAWWIVFLPLASFALFWRCSKAAAADDKIASAITADREPLGPGETQEQRNVKKEALLSRAARDQDLADRGIDNIGFPSAGPYSRSRTAGDEAEMGYARPGARDEEEKTSEKVERDDLATAMAT